MSGGIDAEVRIRENTEKRTWLREGIRRQLQLSKKKRRRNISL